MAKAKKRAKRRLRCTSCGKLDETVKKRIDPFDADVNNTETEVVWCDDCTDERAADV
jgi:hypothetical protein